MSTSEVNECPEWCENNHPIQRVGSHAKYDRCVMVPGIGTVFANGYYESDSGVRGWTIRGILGEIRFLLDGPEPNEEVSARYEKTFAMYQEVANERVATIQAHIKVAIQS